MTVRAKMECGTKFVDESGNTRVELFATYANKDGTRAEENKAFSDATPVAQASLTISMGFPAADAFEAGKEYYVDFIEVPTA